MLESDRFIAPSYKLRNKTFRDPSIKVADNDDDAAGGSSSAKYRAVSADSPISENAKRAQLNLDWRCMNEDHVVEESELLSFEQYNLLLKLADPTLQRTKKVTSRSLAATATFVPSTLDKTPPAVDSSRASCPLTIAIVLLPRFLLEQIRTHFIYNRTHFELDEWLWPPSAKEAGLKVLIIEASPDEAAATDGDDDDDAIVLPPGLLQPGANAKPVELLDVTSMFASEACFFWLTRPPPRPS